MGRSIFILTSGLFSSFSYGQSDSALQEAGGAKYSVFLPVPRDKMKEMEMDRPDVTESAYTVMAGHFQVETDLFRLGRSHTRETQNTQVAFHLANYKLGLTESMDIQLVVPTYVNAILRERDSKRIISRTSGFDDVTLRFKYNLWGHRGERTALALLPYVSFPTGTSSQNAVQGGLVIPFAFSAPGGYNIGTQTGADLSKETDDHYHLNVIYSFTCGREITKNVNAFIEGVVVHGFYMNNTDTYANGGVIYSFSPNVKIDAGIQCGIDHRTERGLFMGMSFRL